MEIEIKDYFQYNAAVTLTMFFISFIAIVLNFLTRGWTNKHIFSTERASLLNPMTYIRLFTHVLGHADWDHFASNYLKILLLGPLIEEKYGSINLLIMILITALATGIANYIKGGTRLLGASDVGFMLIVLSAFVNMTQNKIPITLVLIILFYIVEEVRDLRKRDGIAHYGHLIGAICGGIFGFICVNQQLTDILLNIKNSIL